MKIVTENRKAHFDFFIEDTLECGIVLSGSEVKSARRGKMNLKDSYAVIKNGELFLLNAHISTYDKTSSFVQDELRTRKLLASKAEILKLERKVKEKGYTLVPTKAYFKEQYLKVEIGLAKGKQLFDKKRTKMQSDISRETERAIKSLN